MVYPFDILLAPVCHLFAIRLHFCYLDRKDSSKDNLNKMVHIVYKLFVHRDRRGIKRTFKIARIAVQ